MFLLIVTGILLHELEASVYKIAKAPAPTIAKSVAKETALPDGASPFCVLLFEPPPEAEPFELMFVMYEPDIPVPFLQTLGSTAGALELNVISAHCARGLGIP
jgi:hypothetical protein